MTMQDVLNAVNAQSTVDDSIIALLTSTIEQLKAVQTPVDLTAVIASIEANTAKLQAAVTANTPAGPVTPVAPVATPV
jgi:hypothetical protein